MADGSSLDITTPQRPLSGLRYLSICSGIEAATQAWHPLGWKPVAFSEIEAFPSAVLAHHYPDVPNRGDMTKFQEWPDDTVDLLCGGTPCQSFSVAGLRQGLADPRGNLMLTFGAIAGRYRPRWLVWENVPGVLSSNRGRDFAAFLGLLGELGYGWAYRVLDAQHVRTCRFPRAVPQRRRRVFVVGYLGDWRRAAAVLFDRESLSGHPAPRREAGQGLATSPSLRAQSQSSHRLDSEAFVPIANSGDIGYCLTASAQQSLDAETETLIAVAHALRGEGFDASEDGTGRGTPLVPVAVGFSKNDHGNDAGVGVSPTLRSQGAYGANGGSHAAVAFDLAQITSATNRTRVSPELPGSTLNAAGQMHVAAPWAVRRLTPRECERLQGFPDDFTRIPYRNKPADQCPDGPRYKALGNSWAVNVAEWVGERIAEVDAWDASNA